MAVSSKVTATEVGVVHAVVVVVDLAAEVVDFAAEVVVLELVEPAGLC